MNLSHKQRMMILSCLLLVMLMGVFVRIFQLAVTNRPFLMHQSHVRTVRSTPILAHRGKILDRHGVALAISTPLFSVWVNPNLFRPTPQQGLKLAKLLNIEVKALKHQVVHHRHKSFLYLKRDINPNIADKIRALNIVGMFFQREYQRFYPQGPMTAHILGITNVDDKGQEGLELAYDQWLRGIPGKRLVMKDRLGQVIAHLQTVRLPQKGKDLQLSLDSHIQYLTYRELAAGVEKAHAKAATAIVLEVATGEVLAMVNLPTYNPNQRPRPSVQYGLYRNRAVTDLFEPGSTMKTLSIAWALASHCFKPSTLVDTNPGWLVVGGNTIKDESINHGVISVEQVLKKSSNIGTAKIMLSLPTHKFVHFLREVGFGRRTNIGFPGEAEGLIPHKTHWKPFELATLSFGYGLSVNALQLTQAYSTLAAGGVMRPISLLHNSHPTPGKRVLEASVADKMLTMLQSVVEKGGTGYRARVRGYQVAGKTGTAYIASKHGYDRHRYIASFVGMLPVKHPKFVITVVIWEPSIKYHYGGLIAAPIFSKIASELLRLHVY